MMKNLKKIIALTLASLFVFGIFTACGKTDTGDDVESVKQIRYLNFKPEVADIYQEIAAKYEEETGVKVIVETAAIYSSSVAVNLFLYHTILDEFKKKSDLP